MKTFKLYLLRHGLTEANLKGIYAGSGTDLPLSDEGAAQLDRLAEDFEYPPAPTVFVSPLLRARQGIAIIPDDPRAGQKFFGAYGASKAAQMALWAGADDFDGKEAAHLDAHVGFLQRLAGGCDGGFLARINDTRHRRPSAVIGATHA